MYTNAKNEEKQTKFTKPKFQKPTFLPLFLQTQAALLEKAQCHVGVSLYTQVEVLQKNTH